MSNRVHIRDLVKQGIHNNLAQYDKNALLMESTDKLWQVVDEAALAVERVIATVPIDRLNDRDMTVLLMLCY